MPPARHPHGPPGGGIEHQSKAQLLERLGLLQDLLAANAAAPERHSTEAMLQELQVRLFELEMQNQALQEAHTKLEAAYGLMSAMYAELPVAHLCLDTTGSIQRCNAAAASLLRLPIAAVHLRKFVAFLAPRSRQLFRDEVVQVAAGRAPGALPAVLFDEEEHQRHIEIGLCMGRGSDGQRQTQLTIWDVTAHKSIERRERFAVSASDRFSDLFDEVPVLEAAAQMATPFLADACYAHLFASDGQPDAMWVSLAHEQDQARYGGILGQLGGTIVEHWRTLDAPIEVVLAPLGSSRDLATPIDQRQLRILRALGIGSLVVVPLRARQRTIGAMMFMFMGARNVPRSMDLDFIRSHARQAALAIDNARLHHRARQAVRARERILGIVSHDLNNPLSTILLRSERLLGQGPEEALGERGTRQIKGIYTCGLRMKRLTRDLLDLGRVDAGQLAVECAPHDLRAIVEEAVDAAAEAAGPERVCIEPSVGAAMVLPLDRERLLQVLANLIHNALKFSPITTQVRVRLARTPREVRVSVQDQGSGFDEAQLSRAFEEFWQQPDTAHLGHGLGLYIARGIVRAHGGEMWAENNSGGGASVCFTVPLHGPAPDRLSDVLGA